MNGRPPVPLRFGEFEFHPQSGELRKRGLRVRLTPQAKALLGLLLSLPIRPHSREEIHEELWPGRAFMDLDHALNKAVHAVRKALDDTGGHSRFIETIPRFGYRFLPGWVQPPGDVALPLSSNLGFPIAVLPIRVPGSSSELSFASNRITSALTDALTGLKCLRVRSETTVRNSVTKYMDPQRTGESLGVRTVLSGNLSVHNHELLVRIESIDVHDGTQLCAAEIEIPFPFQRHIEKMVIQDLVERLKPHLLALATPSQSANGEGVKAIAE